MGGEEGGRMRGEGGGKGERIERERNSDRWRKREEREGNEGLSRRDITFVVFK